MDTIFLITYLLTISLCLFTYLFYPVILLLLNYLFRFNIQKREITPNISILIPAYNEGKDIGQKIENTLALDYPKDKMEILVGSDGSTDETREIVKKYTEQGVQLIDFNTNRGKTAVQNDLVKISTREILVFTDAASFLHPNSLKALVRNFADERVGCVGGRMEFVNTSSNITTQSQGIYWLYESKMRELESNLGRLIGVDGPLYAVRRNCYIPLRNHIISDLITPLLVLAQDKKVVLEPEAVVYEDPTYKSLQEFSTRRRITLRGLVSLRHHSELLNPLQYPALAAQLFFHKILRWSIGFLVSLNIVACAFISGVKPFDSILILYLIFFGIAILGWIQAHLNMKNRLFSIPYYFTLVNLAAAMGIIDFFRKKQSISWKPTRHM